ncbi:hypothetical protein AB1E18_002418 [Capra hircus]
MAVSLTTFSGLRTEMGILETNQCLSSQLEKRKQDFQKLTEKFLMSQATVYSLANQCGDCHLFFNIRFDLYCRAHLRAKYFCTTANHIWKVSCESRAIVLAMQSQLKESMLSMGLQEEEANEVLEDPLDEKYLMHSSQHDSHKPPSSNACVCDVQDTSSAVDRASKYSQYKENNSQQIED